MLKKQLWEDLAFYHLHSEQVRVYEQMVSLYSNNQNTNRIAIQTSYKLFMNALKGISDFFQAQDIDFESGSNHKGTYLEFSYPVFARLNAEIPQAMEIMYSVNCIHFKQYTVKLDSEITQSLPDEVLKKYQHTLIG